MEYYALGLAVFSAILAFFGAFFSAKTVHARSSAEKELSKQVFELYKRNKKLDDFKLIISNFENFDDEKYKDIMLYQKSKSNIRKAGKGRLSGLSRFRLSGLSGLSGYYCDHHDEDEHHPNNSDYLESYSDYLESINDVIKRLDKNQQEMIMPAISQEPIGRIRFLEKLAKEINVLSQNPTA